MTNRGPSILHCLFEQVDFGFVPAAAPYFAGEHVFKFETSIPIRHSDLFPDDILQKRATPPSRYYVRRNGQWIRLEDDFSYGIFEPLEDPENYSSRPDWNQFLSPDICPRDTNGDGDCHLCHGLGGCLNITRTYSNVVPIDQP